MTIKLMNGFSAWNSRSSSFLRRGGQQEEFACPGLKACGGPPRNVEGDQRGEENWDEERDLMQLGIFLNTITWLGSNTTCEIMICQPQNLSGNTKRVSNSFNFDWHEFQFGNAVTVNSFN